MSFITDNLDAGRTVNYTYDELLRLLTAQRGPDANIQRKYSYDYDRYGNRWAQTVAVGTGYNTSHSFNTASNRITTSGYAFDNSGNLTANGPGTTYGYNQENFLTSAAGTTTYKIDAQGRRVRKTVSGTVTDYFYSGSEVIAEKTGVNWKDYIFFGGLRIAQQTGASASTATYINADHLGSTRLGTDSNGNSNGSCDYEPLGEVQSGSACNLATEYRFAGARRDPETGLSYFWFRQYDTAQGRWMSVDPLSGDPVDPQSLDRYTYVLNDPIDLVDPSGLKCIEIGDGGFRCEAGDPPPPPGSCLLVYIDGALAGNTCEGRNRWLTECEVRANGKLSPCTFDVPLNRDAQIVLQQVGQTAGQAIHPCTIAGFYGLSAAGAVGASLRTAGAVFSEINTALGPSAVTATTWALRLVPRLGPLAVRASNVVVTNVDKAVQSVCR